MELLFLEKVHNIQMSIREIIFKVKIQSIFMIKNIAPSKIIKQNLIPIIIIIIDYNIKTNNINNNLMEK